MTFPRGMAGPFTGMTRALRIAMVVGASANNAQTATSGSIESRFIGNRLL
jgi:hypothetical protein